MTLVEELKARGLIEHSSTSPEQIFATPRTVYLGIDPTSDSIQIGNLAVVLLMKRLGDAGNPSWYVSELVKLRQERGEVAAPLSNCTVTEEEDRAVLQRMGLAESEVRSLGASPFRSSKSG